MAAESTLERIHRAARAEFALNGFRGASLRRIVRSVGMTTGAFYGYYASKEALFEALVGEAYDYLLGRFRQGQEAFAALPRERQPEVMGELSGQYMEDMLRYAYAHLEECQLLLCCSEGTRFSGLIDEMVALEAEGTHAYLAVLRELGRPAPPIDRRFEHMLITGMFHTFFELIIHEMPLPDAENYLRTLRAFYTAGWQRIMGQ